MRAVLWQAVFARKGQIELGPPSQQLCLETGIGLVCLCFLTGVAKDKDGAHGHMVAITLEVFRAHASQNWGPKMPHQLKDPAKHCVFGCPLCLEP